MKSLRDVTMRYCAGCGHRLMHKLVAEAIDTLGLREKALGIAPVGCAVFAYDYFNFDMVEVAHGRPPAVATAMKRVRPDCLVFTYQGDGDLAAIGTAEIIHAASRGENISVFFINNATYGMTGGQMAPTTIRGQKTSTTPQGRQSGYPLRVAEIMAVIEGTHYVARTSLDSVSNVQTTREAVMKVLRNQVEGKGFSFLEVLSSCPTDWHMSPAEATHWIRSEMIGAFPLGTLKDLSSGVGAGVGS